MSIPNFVRAVEAGPRDGLQNEKSPVSTDTKAELMNRPSGAGFINVEAASFVSPKQVPATIDGIDVIARIQRQPGTLYSVFTLNMRGFEGAATAGADEVVIFSAANEAFMQKNIDCTIAESIERFTPVAKATKDTGIRVRGSVSYLPGCPYRGEVPVSSVVGVIKCMADLGCDGIDTADTTGIDTTGRMKTVMKAVVATFPIDRLPRYFHDTYSQTLTNILVSLEVGIATSHVSVAGLGGCPYAKGATGDVATEDVLYLLHGLGIRTGIDLDKIVLTDDFISQAIGHPAVLRAGRALLPKLQDQTAQACI